MCERFTHLYQKKYLADFRTCMEWYGSAVAVLWHVAELIYLCRPELVWQGLGCVECVTNLPGCYEA